MLRFFYSPKYKYTNRSIIDVSLDAYYKDIDYENIDSADTINGNIIYRLDAGENIPTYVVDLEKNQRWFVSGITQLRTGKYQISMIRDIISESLDWSNERAYINAGTATDYCKYKTWGLPFTNTKVKQERLDINGKSSFFVFYSNQRNVSSSTITEDDLELKYDTVATETSSNVDFDSLEDIPGYEYLNIGKFAYLDNSDRYIDFFTTDKTLTTQSTPSGKQYYYQGVKHHKFYLQPVIDRSEILFPTYNRDEEDITTYESVQAVAYQIGNDYWGSYSENLTPVLQETIVNYQNTLTNSQYDPTVPYSSVNSYSIDRLNDLLGKTIRIPDGQTPGLFNYYEIVRKTSVDNKFTINIPKNNSVSKELLQTIYNRVVPVGWNVLGDTYLTYGGKEYILEYELIDRGRGTSFDFNFTAKTSKLPKSNVRCVNIVSDDIISDDIITKSLMICQTNPDAESENIGRIIDIQYLPFSVATEQNENFKFGDHNAIAQFLTIDDFYYENDLDDLTDINKETDSIVIVSPSRKSQFKFKPYNNDGNMKFSTKITIKPFQSVIYVRPSTEGLLMRDWDDKECLIIQEDFSLTTTNSDWANYVYNNRNYQNAFNLQIQSKDFEREWERKIETAQAESDEWTARNLTAQKFQTYTGNLPIISGIAGAIGTTDKDDAYMRAAQLDRQYNEALYQKTLDISKQTFQYQIENLKSQPLIPNTITAIDVKMLDGVYLEYYSTNDTELESIRNYYLYNGNRIDNYGTFQNYWGGFVRGKIIISKKYTQPELDELNRRLELGVFTGGIL